ncbi:unnamed protein product [Euphydryas editha]|uniref:WD and tetratricopeptide repeats protein 1 n=1 Tax=Euphydryas editha TaxID=104508 RepID=A0AAU9TEG7_EUPED|nr:unnamed protein product [Euphydryas editha]
MGGKEELTWAHGTVGLTVARERGEINRKFQNKLTVTRSMIDRLGLEKELNGHLGCVNCLEWNSDGSVLASASDDLHVILWDPYRHKQIHTLSTGHTGNIFSVKFLSPESLVTCAADGSVRARNIMNGQMLLECACHCGRVKRLAVAPDNPQILWSAGEDGLVLQHDLRCPHRCNSDSDNVLVNLLNHMGRYAEAKCLAVNPRRPYQLAVGANDVYVRLYDIRMIKLARLQELQGGAPNSRLMWERQNVRCSHAGHGDPDNNIPREAVQYFAPGHLSMQPNANSFPKKAVTYLAYSHDGNELLVNMGSEQVYLFDINTASRPMLLESFIIQHNQRCREVETRQPHEVNSPVELPPLPEEILRLKESANLMMNKGNYANAIEIYSRAIAEWPWSALLYSNRAASLLRRSCRVAVERLALLQPRRLALAPQLVSVYSLELYRELYDRAIAEWPWSALLYSNRAASLLRRSWAGDHYAAVRDCYSAVKLDPNHAKSYFRLAKAFMELRKPRESQECLNYFKDRFPRFAESHAVFLLQKDINMALEMLETKSDEASEEEGQSGSDLERQLRSSALDYKCRFVGHCNTTTDIKEANFLGPEANYVAAGSDDGSIFIWCRKTGNIIRCLRGDDSIVNCVQLHPSMFLLATSGIESVVRLWSPRPEDGVRELREVNEPNTAAAANQKRMRSDPFESMMLNISFSSGAERDINSPACRSTRDNKLFDASS